ncbi:unnamed protein product [Linum tenue]|uniref:TIR domain-containing protein n=1 Tax=Linum tenue TaxID=586396 RepID=A0AAV0M3I9_9ROSI|nr:unnamed protein product [Linum tenue]
MSTITQRGSSSKSKEELWLQAGTLPKGEYDIFLSFRDPDVRQTFADCLYSWLVRSGIRTFRDEEELHKGEMIAPSLAKAITESKIHIPILTKDYASSKWCLQELAKMVECWRLGKGYVILPIFYFLDPRDVRHPLQNGAYREAFEQHNLKHDPETVRRWEEALQEVGKMKGWHVTRSDGQGAVIDQVVSEVELHLRSHYTLVTDVLVGIDSHVERVTELLNIGGLGGKIVGIHGMGGIGKTTIAKAVYNKVCTNFDRCCFLENVRGTLSKDGGVVSLQNMVISGILRSARQVTNASEGIHVIRERVSKYKVLIVLDDLDENFELDQVLGNLGSFPIESRFIITTRDLRVLELFEEYSMYEPGEMSYDHSLQLFNRHAFGIDHEPAEEQAPLSKEFVKLAAGLPLAIKVIGSLLYRRDEVFWKAKLIELEAVGPTKVHGVLKISYNELTRHEKQIFLDIACYFVGEDKELPIYMWGGCKFHPETGISTLILRALLKVDEKNRFCMHDHIRDLGRAIVNEEDVERPGNRSRPILCREDVLTMLKNGEAEILRIDMTGKDHYELTNKEVEKLSRLRYLEVRGGRLVGDFSGSLPNMRWLRLHMCRSVPTNLNLKELIILDLYNCGSLADDWRVWGKIKLAHRLKAVCVSSCYGMKRAPDLSPCASMELIKLSFCPSMSGELHIGNMKNLKLLEINSTRITGLTGDIVTLQSLRELYLNSYASVTESPPLLPTSLKALCLSSCPSKLPNLLELKDLEHLSLSAFSREIIPGEICKLSKLKTLSLSNSEAEPFGSVVVLPSSLNSLRVGFCGSLERLPNLGNLNNLMELSLLDVGVYEIRGLGELRILETMSIRKAPNLSNLDGLQSLLLLKKLKIYGCPALEKLPSVANLSNLHRLYIRSCQLISEMQSLAPLRQNLTSLEIDGCPRLDICDSIQSLESLQRLNLTCCRWSVETLLPHLSKLRKLSSLTIGEDTQVRVLDLSSLDVHSNLKQIMVYKFTEMTEVLGLEGLASSLESLGLSCCNSIQKLPDVSGLKKLADLRVHRCPRLTQLDGVEMLESLQRLVVSDCNSVSTLPDLSRLTKLSFLNISECTNLVDVPGLERLESLQELTMTCCTSIKKLPDLSNLKKLKLGCTNFPEVTGFEGREWSSELTSVLLEHETRRRESERKGEAKKRKWLARHWKLLIRYIRKGALTK